MPENLILDKSKQSVGIKTAPAANGMYESYVPNWFYLNGIDHQEKLKDYIVAEGYVVTQYKNPDSHADTSKTNHSGRWRVWNSGFKELWGFMQIRIDMQGTGAGTAGDVYRKDVDYSYGKFPITFTETPHVMFGTSNDRTIPAAMFNTTTTSMGSIRFYRMYNTGQLGNANTVTIGPYIFGV